MKSPGQDYYEALIDQTYDQTPRNVSAQKWEDLEIRERQRFESAALEYERRQNLQRQPQ